MKEEGEWQKKQKEAEPGNVTRTAWNMEIRGK